jgi:hypothetical protein
MPHCLPAVRPAAGSGRPDTARRQRRSAGSVGRLSGEFAGDFGSFGNTERRRDAVVGRGAGPRRGPRKAPLAGAVRLCGGTGRTQLAPARGWRCPVRFTSVTSIP